MPFWLPLRVVIAKHLGRTGPKPIALGLVLGPASSSCSFAALSAGRALFGKGAALVPMMAFLFGATNLSPQVAALAWIFLGWQFALALVLGSVALVAVMALIVRLTCPASMVEQARKDAVKAGEQQSGMADPAEGLQRSVAASRRNLPQRMGYGLEGITDRLPGGWRGGCPGAG